MRIFSIILKHCLDQYAPCHTVVSRYSHHPTPWLIQALSSAIKQKMQAKQRADSTMNDADITLYKKMKNQLKYHIHEAKLSYLKQLLLQTKHNLHSAAKLWSGVNNVIGRYYVCKNNTLNTILSLDPSVTFELLQFLDSAKSGDTPMFQFHAISSSAVLSLVNELDAKKPVGLDGISVCFLKEIAEPITAPLTTLYNKPLEAYIIPNQWKCSNVTPVHKGDHVIIQ